MLLFFSAHEMIFFLQMFWSNLDFIIYFKISLTNFILIINNKNNKSSVSRNCRCFYFFELSINIPRLSIDIPRLSIDIPRLSIYFFCTCFDFFCTWNDFFCGCFFCRCFYFFRICFDFLINICIKVLYVLTKIIKLINCV